MLHRARRLPLMRHHRPLRHSSSSRHSLGTDAADLVQLVDSSVKFLRQSKDIWNRLPNFICTQMKSSNEQTCWNGLDVSKLVILKNKNCFVIRSSIIRMTNCITGNTIDQKRSLLRRLLRPNQANIRDLHIMKCVDSLNSRVTYAFFKLLLTVGFSQQQSD